jgi:hypothetical protein
MSGKDHRNYGAVVGNVETGVCKGFVFRNPIGGREMSETSDLVVQTNDQAVDRADRATGDVVGTVVGLLFEENEELVSLVGEYVFNKIVSDCADKLIGNGDAKVSH